jgi:hypothetical protein
VREYDEEAAKMANPVDVALSSWPSVASKRHKWTDAFFDRDKLTPAPPETLNLLDCTLSAPCILQLMNFESMMATDVARETEIAPPVTAVLGESAPRAAQLKKLQDAKTATE